MNPTKPGSTDKPQDLPRKALKPETADQVRGGAPRPDPDPDILDELEVQR